MYSNRESEGGHLIGTFCYNEVSFRAGDVYKPAPLRVNLSLR